MITCKIKSIKKISSEPRYDIEVEENNNFYANNILVHNCRCIATKNGLFSRQGKNFISIPHIEKILKPIFEKYPGAVFDGELYNHDFRDNFNKIISLVRKSKPTEKDLIESEKLIQYHIYDFPADELLEKDSSFEQRSLSLIYMIGDCFVQRDVPNTDLFCETIKLVETRNITSQEELDKAYASFLEKGYEGQMIRYNNFKYENKRVNHLLKRKEFQDEEFEIVEIIEGSGNRSNMAGSITYKLPDGRTFDSGIKGGEDYYKEIWDFKDNFKNGKGTVRFFQYTPDGKPRFPVTVNLFAKNEKL